MMKKLKNLKLKKDKERFQPERVFVIMLSRVTDDVILKI